MIARLRACHRSAAFLLPLLVPALLWIVAQRPEAAQMQSLPEALLPDTPAEEVHWSDAAGEPRIQLGRTERDDDTWVLLRTTEPLRRPDVLVYWLETAPAGGEGVPENATFAGRLRGAGPLAFRAPAPGGHLLLFSLGHQERVAQVSLVVSQEIAR